MTRSPIPRPERADHVRGLARPGADAGGRRYLKQHAWGSATGDDFLGAQVPLLLRTPAGLTRVLLKTPEARVALPDRQCPAWLAPNVGGVGYYRASMAPALLQAFVREGEPTAVELMALLDDQRGLAESGELPLADFVRLIGEIVAASAPQADERRDLLLAAATALGSIRPLLSAAQLPGYARLWQQQFGAMARRLGWQVAAGDSSDRRLLRQTLLPLVAKLGQDEALRSQARALARAWLVAADGDGAAHPEALDPDLRGAVLQSAAAGGDAALFDALISLARCTPIRRVREDLLESLAHFEAPWLAGRARGLLLDPAVDVREILPDVLAEQSRHPALAADVVLAFVGSHDAALRARLGSQAPAHLPAHLSRGCGADQAAALQQMFGPQASSYEGGPGLLAKATEGLRLCGAYREAQAASLRLMLVE